jgi:transcriptional regulator NrdR family protein
MKILKCIMCKGEVDIVNSDSSSNNKIKCKIKCKKCGFTNINIKTIKEPEIVVIKKKHTPIA